MHTLLIDADSLAFRAGLASEIRIEHPESSWVSVGFDKDVLWSHWEAGVKDWVDGALKALGDLKTYKQELIFTASDNFRNDFYPEYKKNRSMSNKPAGYYWIREKLRERGLEKVWPRLEADDVCGIMQTWHASQDQESCILSIDKDMRTIPGLLYNPDKDELHRITKHGAEIHHMTQTVHGDTTDNFPGLPGYGEATLLKWLKKNEIPHMNWGAIEKLWTERTLKLQENGTTEISDLLTQARCAKILTMDQWDFKNREVMLWELPSV